MKALFGKYRSLVFFLAGLALFAATFQVAELIVGPGEMPQVVESPEPPSEPISIEVLRPDDSSVVIEIDGSRHTTVRLDPGRDGGIDEVVTCIEDGIEQARKDGLLDPGPAAGLFAFQRERQRVGEQVTRIQSTCFHASLAGHRHDD